MAESANEKLGLPRGTMQKVMVAIDVDGTLRNNKTDEFIPNERIRTLLIILSSFKNVHIHVWSGSGELYARQAATALAVTKYVKSYSGKAEHLELRKKWDGRMVIIDDIQNTMLGDVNLIVCEK